MMKTDPKQRLTLAVRKILRAAHELIAAEKQLADNGHRPVKGIGNQRARKPTQAREEGE